MLDGDAKAQQCGNLLIISQFCEEDLNLTGVQKFPLFTIQSNGLVFWKVCEREPSILKLRMFAISN